MSDYETYSKEQDWTIYYLDAEAYAGPGFESIKGALGPWLTNSDFTSVLDFACGYGRIAQYFAPFSKKIIFSDIRQDAVDMCKKRYEIYRSAGPTHPLGNCEYEYIRNTEDNIPLENDSVTFIYSWDALVHLEVHELKPVLKEFARILAPGGRGVIHHSNISATVQPARRIWHSNLGSRAWMSAEDVAGFLREEGLEPKGLTMEIRSEIELDGITIFEKPLA